MKKMLLVSVTALLLGCMGETFTFSGGEGGSGGEVTSSTSVGGAGSSSTTSVTTDTSSSTSGGTGGSELTYSDLLVSDCLPDYVFVPFTGYNLIGDPAVSCIPVPQGQSSLIIDSYTYNLFRGSAMPTMSACDSVDHPSVWFVTNIEDNGDIIIPSDVFLNEQTVPVDKLMWSDFVTPNFVGMTASVNVKLNDTITISDKEMFCFGHRFTESADGNPTCLVSCLNESNYTRHQISDSGSVPYNFNAASIFPPDADLTKHYSFATSVYAASVLITE